MFTEYLSAYFFILNLFLLFEIMIWEYELFLVLEIYFCISLCKYPDREKRLTSALIWNIIFQVSSLPTRAITLFIPLYSRRKFHFQDCI